MHSRFLTAVTLATVTLLSFTSITKAENITPLEVTTPESPAVIRDETPIPTDIKSQSESIEPNTNNSPSDSIENLPSNSAAKVGSCGKQ